MRLGWARISWGRARGCKAALALALGGALFSAGAGSAFAADDDKVIFPGSSPKSETISVPKGGSLNTVTLLVALALAAGGGWLVWRNRRGTSGPRGTQSLAVEETRPLGNRQYLVVASYEGKKFLLGVCPGQINLLSPLTNSADEPSSLE